MTTTWRRAGSSGHEGSMRASSDAPSTNAQTAAESARMCLTCSRVDVG